MKSEEFVFDLGAFKLAGQIFNPEQKGPTILALHGWLDNSASFNAVARALPDYKIIALDFIGHGYSDHLPAGVPYHFLDHVTHTYQFISNFKLDKFIILGHSLGGAIGSLLAAIIPKQVLAWLSIDIFGPMVQDPKTALEDLKKATLTFPGAEKKQLPAYESVEKARKARELFTGDPPGLLQDVVARGTRQVDAGYIWRTDPRLRVPAPMRYSEAHIKTLFAGIHSPGLFIEATKGLEHVKKAYELRKGYAKKLRHVYLEGGHHAHIEQPERCAELIRDFFKSINL